jgi:ribosomal protein L11 methyltransferase
MHEASFMKAYRLMGIGRDPLAAEGAPAHALWEAGASGVEFVNDDLVGFFASAPTGPLPEGGRWEAVDTSDHVAAYHRTLVAVDVGDLVVAPTHRDVTLRPGQTVVWLDPGMAFGTGHHETTRLALEALTRLELRGRHVLDVGSGSGLLAIAADRLGAADAWGLDVDAETIAVATANARANRSRVRFVAGGFGEVDIPGPVDVLVANLYAELHVAFMPIYAATTCSGADLLLTGILHPRDALVREAVSAHASAFETVAWERASEWWLVHLRRRS